MTIQVQVILPMVVVGANGSDISTNVSDFTNDR